MAEGSSIGAVGGGVSFTPTTSTAAPAAPVVSRADVSTADPTAVQTLSPGEQRAANSYMNKVRDDTATLRTAPDAAVKANARLDSAAKSPDPKAAAGKGPDAKAADPYATANSNLDTSIDNLNKARTQFDGDVSQLPEKQQKQLEKIENRVFNTKAKPDQFDAETAKAKLFGDWAHKQLYDKHEVLKNPPPENAEQLKNLEDSSHQLLQARADKDKALAARESARPAPPKPPDPKPDPKDPKADGTPPDGKKPDTKTPTGTNDTKDAKKTDDKKTDDKKTDDTKKPDAKQPEAKTTDVKIDQWVKGGDHAKKNDTLVGILHNAGYSDKEIYSGGLLDRVKSMNPDEVKGKNYTIQAGHTLHIPTKPSTQPPAKTDGAGKTDGTGKTDAKTDTAATAATAVKDEKAAGEEWNKSLGAMNKDRQDQLNKIAAGVQDQAAKAKQAGKPFDAKAALTKGVADWAHGQLNDPKGNPQHPPDEKQLQSAEAASNKYLEAQARMNQAVLAEAQSRFNTANGKMGSAVGALSEARQKEMRAIKQEVEREVANGKINQEDAQSEELKRIQKWAYDQMFAAPNQAQPKNPPDNKLLDAILTAAGDMATAQLNLQKAKGQASSGPQPAAAQPAATPAAAPKADTAAAPAPAATPSAESATETPDD